METDTAVTTSSSHRHRSLPRVRADTNFGKGRSPPSVRRSSSTVNQGDSRNSRSSSPKSENLAASFPLFFFGAGCVASAVFVILEGSGATIGRIPLWIPFIALGIVALVGGTLSVFAEPDELKPEPNRGELSDVNEGMAFVPKARPRPQPLVSPASGVQTPLEPPAVRQRSPLPAPAVAVEEVSTDLPPRPDPTTISASSEAELPDSSALLKEIDLIDADLHSRLGSVPTFPPEPQDYREDAPVAAARVSVEISAPVPEASGTRFARANGPLESEAPRPSALCVGCGSVILNSRAPFACQVCGEPLCSDCRDRGLREGKPNLCPLCSLLDSVHSKRAPPTGPTSARR
jgi:hypothetical protein